MATYWLAMYHVDRLVCRIPEYATRNEVRSILKGLHERKVSAGHIPAGASFARAQARVPGATTYSYYYIIPSLEVIVVYDRDGKMVSLIAAYE